jgi:hypothetical protein
MLDVGGDTAETLQKSRSCVQSGPVDAPARLGHGNERPNDGQTVPNEDVWPQIIEEVAPSLVITTGTAGGIGKDCEMGDVAISPHRQLRLPEMVEEGTLPVRQLPDRRREGQECRGGQHAVQGQFRPAATGQQPPAQDHRRPQRPQRCSQRTSSASMLPTTTMACRGSAACRRWATLCWGVLPTTSRPRRRAEWRVPNVSGQLEALLSHPAQERFVGRNTPPRAARSGRHRFPRRAARSCWRRHQ